MKRHVATILALGLCFVTMHLLPCADAATIEIPAWAFNRGNAQVEPNPDPYFDYRDIHPNLVATGGDKLPWVVEYDVEFPVATNYTLKIRYASEESRPLDLWLDGRKLATCCDGATGDSEPYADRLPAHDEPRRADRIYGAKWEQVCELSLSKGTHTLKLTREGVPPRVLALRLDSPVAFPRGWEPDTPSVAFDEQEGWMWRIKYAARTRYAMGFARAHPTMNMDRIPPTYRYALSPPGTVNAATLRLAIEDKIATYGAQYRGGPKHLAQLAELAKNDRTGGTPERAQQVQEALVTLRQEAMLEHPLLRFDKLLFVKRITETSGHIYEDHYGGKTLGGNLCVLSPVAPGGKVTELVPELAGGLFGRFDLSFDASRIVFSYKKDVDAAYRIHEIGIDPSTGRAKSGSLRQLTFESPNESGRKYQGRGYDDLDPCYLPNGKIMFASTRSEQVVFCFGTAVTTLHVMDGDGKNLHRISEGPLTEIDPCVMDDGRVIYMRWEYMDKGFGNVQSLWSVNPDGSGAAHVFKNNIVVPAGMVDPRSIPGSSKIVTIAAPHCGLSVGPVVLLDTRADRRSGKAMRNITPEIVYPGMAHHAGAMKFGYFKEPYPLSEKLFLVAHNPHKVATEPTGYGLYVLDSWGNRAELYRDPAISCFQPVPLRPRRKPTTIAPTPGGHKVAGTKDERPATLFLQDVYRGLPNVERGSVKYLRVMEAFALSWDAARRSRDQGDGTGLQAATVSMQGDVHLKKIHGVVPVHEDGSACFTVPSGKNLFFQALDENYMELQRMRTFVNLNPGEKRSCIGCHERRRSAPSVQRDMPQALARAPMRLVPQPGDTGPRMVHYVTDVQPILNRRCISCHGGKRQDGGLDLSGELTKLFCKSYENLIDNGLISYLYGCHGEANIPAEPSQAFGSHRSGLVAQIRKAPCKSKLSREEFIKIVTWIDSNAPFYGTHQGKKNLKWKDEVDFRPTPTMAAE